jgi:LuxR family transcriptional regulator of csgAB operon
LGVSDLAKALNNKKEYNVYIIGADGICNELLIYFLEHSTNPSFNSTLLNKLSMLDDIKVSSNEKNLVLCNCFDAHEHDQPNACARHIERAPGGFYWACINVPQGKKIAENAISNGVHGIFFENDSLLNLKKGILAILNGELWFSRDTMTATLSSLVEKNNIKSSFQTDQAGLTKREKEIFRLIATGKTNEEVASRLHISTLTVKTHVSNIYRKIDVPNRIQAIFWATKNYLQLKD